MSQESQKQAAANAAMKYVEEGMIVGIGTGSTVKYFIEELEPMKHDLEGVVSSSEQSTAILKEKGFPLMDLNAAGTLPLYVDGADEFDQHKRLIKGGGGALTREKVIAAASQKFVCMVDESKQVDVLGTFPLPIEVLPMARSYVGRQMVAMGGQPELREGYKTDNGNLILDVYHLKLTDPVAVETTINQIAGVIAVGLFAKRGADIIIKATNSDIELIQ